MSLKSNRRHFSVSYDKKRMRVFLYQFQVLVFIVRKALTSELEGLVGAIHAYMDREKKKRRVQDLVKERHTQLALLKVNLSLIT